MKALKWLAVLLLMGCGREPSGPGTITETREVGPPVGLRTNLTTAERLLPQTVARGQGAADVAGERQGAAPLTWTLPDGWTLAPARAMRLATFRTGPEGEVECYIAELGGMGGGIAANLNRWRGQLGQSPLSEAELAELPTIPMLGQDAPLLEVTGTYRGMGDTEQADSKLLGAVAVTERGSYFVKLVGPAAAVDAVRGGFEALCQSLKPAE